MPTQFFRTEMFPESDGRTMGLGEFEHKVDSNTLLVPLYQREYVWTKTQQQGYLKSIARGFPLFGPVINVDMETGLQYIMDGQNRLFTIHKFLKDKIPFEGNEEGSVLFSELPDNQKRRFRNKVISYIETRGWTPEDCQEFFVSMNEGGVKLKSGELIHADRTNILTQAILGLETTYTPLLKAKASEGGFQLSLTYLKRYGHYEILGTIFHMAATLEFPLRPGQTALEELDKWRSTSEPTDIFKEALALTRALMDQYQHLLLNVPRLRQKVKKEDHLRLMYFLLKTNLYREPLKESHYVRFETLLNRILNKDNPEYTQIISWGTGDYSQIYDLYHKIYVS